MQVEVCQVPGMWYGLAEMGVGGGFVAKPVAEAAGMDAA